MSETGSQYKLECSLHGHELDVRAVIALSNDLVVSAARDKTVRSWNRTQANDFEQQNTYLGHSHYVNALASLPPSPEHPKGLIVSSGSDKVINVYDVDRPDDPVYTLVGHTENVCSLAVTASGDIISGSWDKLAIVWKGFQQAYVLKGHEAAVWSVLSVDNDRVLTASADKTIKLWTNGKLTQTFNGHTDVVRDMALISGLGFVSCSNDSSLRLWSLSGETLMELNGHTSFVYSVSVLSTGELVSSGEDRSVRIWKDGQCIQTIHQPCISVWCVNALPNDDIIVGGSDGIVRLFTRAQERFADQETLKQFDDLVASHAIPSNQVGDVKKDDLPGTEALHVPGRKEGQVLMVRNGDVVEAHQWSSATGTWTKVGEVVDAVGSNRKQVYNGQEYDYVFDIDIGAGPDGMLKLPFNVTENPYDAAQKFIWKHELPQDFLDQIADFIIKNAKGVEIGMSNSAQYVDPYTGAARYTPETRAADANAIYSDPFTGSSSYSTNSAAKAAEPKILPQRSPLLFKQASLSAIHKKILSTNAEIDAALSQEDIEKLNEGVHYLQNPVANVSDDKHLASISAILKIITTWPVELRFPGLDLIRLYALYQPSALLSSITDGDLESFFRTWANLNQLSEYADGQKATDKTLETNYMLAVRTYANLFGTDIGSDYIKRQKQAIISLLLTDGSWKSFQTKNFRLALATLFLNFSVHLSKASTDEEDELLLVQNIIEYLKEELDVENVYRAMVAVGTLLSQSSNAKEAAVVFDGPVVLQNVTRQQSDVRIRKVAGEYLTQIFILKPTGKMVSDNKINVLMVGTGEYTTGYVNGASSTSDKKIGVVALTMFDLRRLGKVGDISMVGTNGQKLPAIREHLNKNIGEVYNMDTELKTFPADSVKDRDSYKEAIDSLKAGDAITIFTPDPTHYPIALYAIQRGVHVLLTKPAVKLLEEHQNLIKEAKKNNVFVMIEHHKRFDPAYADAKGKAAGLGSFNYFYSYMSQPKKQLETFRAWIETKESDISYYLNSHHIDLHCWMVEGRAVPYKVTASAGTGIATSEPFNMVEGTEDTITLLVNWRSTDKGDPQEGTAVYTASWTAPKKSEVHSQQYFHYLGAKGEVRVDQAHRGYSYTTDEDGYANINPFYMKYTPSEDGHFDGQRGYGYVSLEKFIDNCQKINSKAVTAEDLDKRGLPTIKNTELVTAILEAGRRSLDEQRSIELQKSSNNEWTLV